MGYKCCRKSYFPESRSEAYAIADQAYNAGQSFDVGIMQINSYWLKKYRIAIEEVLEPQKNIAMGVWILAREIQRYGLTWQAIGAYHTPLARNLIGQGHMHRALFLSCVPYAIMMVLAGTGKCPALVFANVYHNRE